MHCLWRPFLCYIGASIVLTSLAGALVAVMEVRDALTMTASYLTHAGQPIAAGSGVPEIKAYLNGIKVRERRTMPWIACAPCVPLRV